MNLKKATLSIAMGLLAANGVLAHGPGKEFDVNSVIYIEDEAEINLGFDTADYLPEGFDPHKVYFDLGSVTYIEEELPEVPGLSAYLPADFDAYAYPSSVDGFNYLDANDEIILDFDTADYLPENFNAFRGYHGQKIK
ncbi:MAG: hypothetical protein AAFX53_12395 [Bacteroidota bacterium]